MVHSGNSIVSNSVQGLKSLLYCLKSFHSEIQINSKRIGIIWCTIRNILQIYDYDIVFSNLLWVREILFYIYNCDIIFFSTRTCKGNYLHVLTLPMHVHVYACWNNKIIIKLTVFSIFY